MAWGSPDVTRRRIQADQTINYSTGVTGISLQHVGMIKSLLLRLNAVIAYTKSGGGSTQDAQGPWNLINKVDLSVNGIGTFLSASMWQLYLYNLVHYAPFDPASSDNTAVLQTQTATNIFAFPSVPGASGNITILGQLKFPFTVELAGVKEIGLWTLQNDEVNLQLTPTWNANGFSSTALAAPYDIAGGDSGTVTAASTSLDVVREFYAVPSSKSDYPITGWFHQLVSQRVSLTSTQTDFNIPKGGIVLRGIYQLVDGGTPSLMTNSSLTSLEWVYGSNEIPFSESAKSVLARQRQMYKHDLPIGVYTHDFWGMGGQTLKDCYDTEKYQNLRVRFNTPSTPTAGSYADVLIERLIPITGNAEKLY
jgi:hypothetical protein